MMNTGFKNAFKAEMYKLTCRKNLVKLLIAIVIIFIVYSLVFNFMSDLFSEYSFSYDENNTMTVQQKYEAYQTAYNQYLESVSNAPDSYKPLMDTTVYEYKALMNTYKFLAEHNLSDSAITAFGSHNIATANGYILSMMSVMAMVIIIYSMVSISKSMAGELSSGAMKMELLRPINRDSFMAAKYLSVWLTSIILYVLMFVISGIVGVIFFKIDAKDVLVSLNGTSVFLISPVVEMLIYLFYYIFTTFVYIQMSLFFSNITKGKGAAIALPLVIYLVGANIEKLLGYIYIGYAGFMINCDWISAFTATGPTLNYMNLYSMLAITIAWTAIFTGISHILFRKRDIQN